MPGVADDEASVNELAEFCCSCGAEEVFAEPVNAHGPGLRLVQDALHVGGFTGEASSVGLVRKQAIWSAYCTKLVKRLRRAMLAAGAIDKLRFLLYPALLVPNDLSAIRQHEMGIQWLGKSDLSVVRRCGF